VRAAVLNESGSPLAIQTLPERRLPLKLPLRFVVRAQRDQAISGPRARGRWRPQLMCLWRFSVLEAPGSAGAIRGPGIDGSMMPSSSHA